MERLLKRKKKKSRSNRNKKRYMDGPMKKYLG